MDILLSYLDTMFAPYPATARLGEAKAELATMMEDAYNAAMARGLSDNEAIGEVLTQFGNLDEVAPALGITADINPSTASAGTAQPVSGQYPPLTMAEAQSYGRARERTQSSLATAVALFVLSPAVLIFFSSDESPLVSFVGLAVLLLCVAVGVVILINRSRETASFRRISEGEFSPTWETTTWAENQERAHGASRTTALSTAFILWVFAALVIIGGALLGDSFTELNGFWASSVTNISVAVGLVIVATGLFILLRADAARAIAEKLTKRDSSEEEETSSRGGRAILAVYWPLVTAIYLGWSLITESWGTTWIIWPIAGLLFAAIAAMIGVLFPAKKN